MLICRSSSTTPDGELREAREQQIATSEVLKANIPGSPGDLEAVFEVMLENAMRICEARSGNLLRYEEARLRSLPFTTRRRHLSMTGAGIRSAPLRSNPSAAWFRGTDGPRCRPQG